MTNEKIFGLYFGHHRYSKFSRCRKICIIHESFQGFVSLRFEVLWKSLWFDLPIIWIEYIFQLYHHCVEDPHYLQKLSRNLRECEYEFSLNEYESLLCLFDLKDNLFREARNCILHLQIKNKSQIVCAIVSHSMQNKTTKF